MVGGLFLGDFVFGLSLFDVFVVAAAFVVYVAFFSFFSFFLFFAFASYSFLFSFLSFILCAPPPFFLRGGGGGRGRTRWPEHNVASKLLCAFVLSRLDYCNSLLAGCPK